MEVALADGKWDVLCKRRIKSHAHMLQTDESMSGKLLAGFNNFLMVPCLIVTYNYILVVVGIV